MGRKEEQTEMVEALEMTTVQQTQSIYWSGKRRKRGMGTKDMEHVSSTCQEDFSTALSVTFFRLFPRSSLSRRELIVWHGRQSAVVLHPPIEQTMGQRACPLLALPKESPHAEDWVKFLEKA